MGYPRCAIRCLSRIQLVCRDLERSTEFYGSAFGFERASELAMKGPELGTLLGITGAAVRGATMQLGRQTVEFIEITPRGLPCPDDLPGTSSLFQHFAIVVDDMRRAMASLSAQKGDWRAISTEVPESLPPSSGGVQAFKFRDPDGHPLELLSFPAGGLPARWQTRKGSLFLGIDHSAISVADSTRSIEFYRRLGLSVVGRSLNSGREQDRLDGLSEVTVAVTALAPARVPPHVELLCYRNSSCTGAYAAINDIAATRLVFDVDGLEALAAPGQQDRSACLREPVEFEGGTWRAMLRDPDGHLLMLEERRVSVSSDRSDLS
jgi:catechol 2,3-dioxygenase-like lactoylglutathione lyase family enzyme